MKAFARVVVVILALVAFAVSFAGATAALDVYQPANSKVASQIQFVVKPYPKDTFHSVAQRLQDDGLIRNALVFEYWARFKHLDSSIQPGVYFLSPSMSTNQILGHLQQAPINTIFINVPDGMRATQYPPLFTALQNFDANQFLTIAKSGIEPDGTKLWKKYWYVYAPPATGSQIAYVLEGYLYPAGYDFYLDSDAKAVIEKMLTQFGVELCPGPDSNPTQYISDPVQCRAHAATINGKNIFALARAAYPDATSDTMAIHDALIISSLATREIRYRKDLVGVAAMYHNRYLHDLDVNKYPADVGQTFGSDPSVEYARDTDNPPTDPSKWWVGLINISGKDVSPNNPYNTYTHPDMPPGPIANPYWDAMEAAIAPSNSPYWYIYSDNCGKIYYAKDFAGFEQIQAQAQAANAKC